MGQRNKNRNKFVRHSLISSDDNLSVININYNVSGITLKSI